VSLEMPLDEADLARRFVQRLAALSPGLLRPAVPPLLDRDPYLSAWINVEAALGNAPPRDRERLRVVIDELDGELAVLPLEAGLDEAARRAVRGLLARRWLATAESFTFVYEPFEALIPLSSLAPSPAPPADRRS
jgi:hypothetical protein